MKYLVVFSLVFSSLSFADNCSLSDVRAAVKRVADQNKVNVRCVNTATGADIKDSRSNKLLACVLLDPLSGYIDKTLAAPCINYQSPGLH